MSVDALLASTDDELIVVVVVPLSSSRAASPLRPLVTADAGVDGERALALILGITH